MTKYCKVTSNKQRLHKLEDIAGTYNYAHFRSASNLFGKYRPIHTHVPAFWPDFTILR